MEKQPGRRRFLGTLAMATAGWSCARLVSPAKSTDASLSSADVPGVPDVGPDDLTTVSALADLRGRMQGPVLEPGDAQFLKTVHLFNTRFDSIVPQAVAVCQSVTDVQACVNWARQHGVPVRARAGGHSYAGFSSAAGALMVDVRPLSTIQVDAAAGRVTIGGGTLTVDVQAALWPQSLALSTGSGPTVGMAGLTLGGGYGLISRKFGMTCDALVEAQVVLASGEAVICNANQAPDLFWALRGGGGGNFGIVTSFTYAVQPADQGTTFRKVWPWQQAAAVVDAWQRWAPLAPDALTATCHLFAFPGKGPEVSIGGAFLGTPAELTQILKQLDPLLAMAGADPVGTPDTSHGPYATEARQWVDCDGIQAHCHLAELDPAGQVERATYRARSHYITQLLAKEGITAMVQAVEAWNDATQLAGILLDPYGGAIGAVAPDATAFVHRDVLFSCQMLAFVAPPGSLAPQDPWLDGLYDTLKPFASGQTYQNYVDVQLADYHAAYWGANLAKLKGVREKYDPSGFFAFPQAI